MHKSEKPLDGRLLILLSNVEKPVPRVSIRDDYKSQQVFDMDKNKWEPSTTKLFRSSSSYHGYPSQKFDQLEEEWYYVQAFLNIYENFNLSKGHVVQLPPDKGEGQ